MDNIKKKIVSVNFGPVHCSLFCLHFAMGVLVWLYMVQFGTSQANYDNLTHLSTKFKGKTVS